MQLATGQEPMKILAIETSCDETAVSILECAGDETSAIFSVLGNALLTQIDIHKEYGGVFPAIAKREHAKNLVPLLGAALEEAELLHEDTQAIPEETHASVVETLAREPGLTEAFLSFITECEVPAIDAIAVTHGPGLEPALWVGVNFAKALSVVWNKPIVGVSHMEGHLISALSIKNGEQYVIENIHLPILALLISGGHTELLVMKEWLQYELVGKTLDDAVGEAFDKVARMMNLPYPGGPEISKLAERDREDAKTNHFKLPRPMLGDPACNFSFSGLKTAVLYLIKERAELSDVEKEQLAREFEDAVADVLYAKTSRALALTEAKTLTIGGGVSANTTIRREFEKKIAEEHPEVTLRIPIQELTTDNAVMIGMAGYFRALKKEFTPPDALRADGNLSLSE